MAILIIGTVLALAVLGLSFLAMLPIYRRIGTAVHGEAHPPR